MIEQVGPEHVLATVVAAIGSGGHAVSSVGGICDALMPGRVVCKRVDRQASVDAGGRPGAPPVSSPASAGGWLSLLAATCRIDLRQYPAAAARLRTAGQLADHAEHPEIKGWCLETEAWQALTEGEYQHAMILSQGAQDVAPRRSSAYIQATGQEGRAWARMGEGTENRAALNRIHQMVSPVPMPDRPEHHFRYDLAKSEAYTATTLSWLGDPAAVGYERQVLARQVLARLESTDDGGPRPRRAASARLDLALALLATDEPGEAGHITLQAVMSGLLVPSNYWRAKEVIAGVEEQGLAEAVELREAYRELYGRSSKAERPQLSA
ncbi:hypothetical protein [Nonomuraea angiospora]